MPMRFPVAQALLAPVLAGLVAVAPLPAAADHDGWGRLHGGFVIRDDDARDAFRERREARRELWRDRREALRDDREDFFEDRRGFFEDREDFFEDRAEWLARRHAFRGHDFGRPHGFDDHRFDDHRFDRHRFDDHRFGDHRFGPRGFHGHGFRPDFDRRHSFGGHAFRRGFPPRRDRFSGRHGFHGGAPWSR